MITTRLEIGGENYAIVNNIPISTNFVQADLREPDKRNASFTKTITLYGNNKLNKLFENIFEANIDLQSFNPNLKETAKYFVDETQVLTGALQLLKITKTPDNNIVYECSIIGNEGNLFVDIGDKYLEELDFSEYNHDYTRANQIASWTNNCKVSGVSTNVGMGKGYYYGFVQRGLGTNSDSVFSVKEFFPQLFVREYLEKIFAQGGYTWDSDFLDSTEFKSILVEPNINVLEMSQSQLDGSNFYGGLTTDVNVTPIPNNNPFVNIVNFNDDFTAPFFDLGSQINGTSVTLANTGYYNLASSLKFKLRVTHTDTAVTYAKVYLLSLKNTIEKSVNGGSTWTPMVNNENFNIAYTIPVNTDIIITVEVATGEMLLNAGNIFRVKAQASRSFYNPLVTYLQGIEYFNASNVQVGVDDDPAGTFLVELDSGATGSSFYGIITAKQTVEGNPLEVNQALPKQIKQKDFVKSVMQAFNLYLDFDKNDPKKIIIESYNDYFNFGASVDWANKIDLEKPVDINPISMVDGKRYIFRYKEDKDYYNQKYLNKYAETFGTRRIDITNDFKKEDKINELIFSPTPNVANYTLSIAVPKIYKEQNGGNIVPNIRMLYAGGVKNTGATWTYKQSGLADQTMTTYGYCGHTDDPITPTKDLNFGVLQEPYYTYVAAKFTTNNLYNRYHKNFILNVTSKNSKVMTAYLWLSPLDIKTFSFRKKYFIDNAYYIVNKIIDYNPYETQSTKVELIKILNTDLFTPTTEFFYDNPTISTGVDVGIAVDESSANYSQNSINMGLNSVAIGEGIFIPATATNVLVNAQNVTIGENVSNVTVINTSNITVTESNVSYINGVYYPTYTILSGGLGVDADVNVLSGGLNSNLQNSIIIDGN
jgi:hypothetical protein